jgi:hypothetical protein
MMKKTTTHTQKKKLLLKKKKIVLELKTKRSKNANAFGFLKNHKKREKRI